MLRTIPGSRIETYSLSLQADGKSVIAGRIGDPVFTSSNLFAGRFTADGLPDETFGTAGIVITDIPGNKEIAADSLIQPDGKILLGGSALRRQYYEHSALPFERESGPGFRHVRGGLYLFSSDLFWRQPGSFS